MKINWTFSIAMSKWTFGQADSQKSEVVASESKI